MTSILGISGYYHDSAAALIEDGQVTAAVQEERFTRKKHDDSFPKHAVDYCLSAANRLLSDVDYVVFYEKPLLKFDRLVESYLAIAPRGFVSFTKSIPLWLKKKLFLHRELRKELGKEYTRRVLFTEHHESHAASAFFPSPFEQAAILTIDGVGEWATASLGVGEGNHLRLTHELRFPHSLGMLYSAFTYYCGFRVNSGEYKLMGLAPYGEPKYADVICERLLDLRPDGSFRLNMDYFGFVRGLTMTSRKFHQLFGRPPRRPESPLSQLDMDLAASIQRVTEEIVLKLAAYAYRCTGKSRLCLAGGVALNCVANGRVLREGPFEDLWIQPAAGDAGGALGAALFVWHQLLEQPRTPSHATQRSSFLGPEYRSEQIDEFLRRQPASAHRLPDSAEMDQRVAGLLAQGKVVGWFQGRMEFGPRALGHRSILGDPRSPEMQSVMNRKIKFRESFRPFAPSVLHDQATQYFEIAPHHASPYMLLVADVVREKRKGTQSDMSPPSHGLERLNDLRSEIPAVTHVDYSARLQTVDPQLNPRYYGLLKAFEARTGCPLLINTSFNVRGEPIVCTLEDAYRCFMATNMDALVLEDFLLLKAEQPRATQHPIDEYLARFDLD